MSGYDLQVWFGQESEVSVNVRSLFSEPDEEVCPLEAWLFTSFAARQIANLGIPRGPGSIAAVLSSLEGDSVLAQVATLLGGVKVGDPTGHGGIKGFIAEFRPERNGHFKMKPHGFGLFGGGVGAYAGTSTLALLWWLCNRRRDESLYQALLANAARRIGNAGTVRAVTVRSQTECAHRTWVTALEDTRKLLDSGSVEQDVEAEVPYPEAQQAADQHGIDLEELQREAKTLLAKTLDDLKRAHGDDTIIAVPNAVGLATCQLLVFAAATETDTKEWADYQAAQDAVDAATKTGNDELLATAQQHLCEVLEGNLSSRGLDPIVAMIWDCFFYSDYPPLANAA